MRRLDTKMDAAPPDEGPADIRALAQDEQAQGGRRGDTRARIQQVALELFAEQGYERTSLREIAERLGVTKAALYYHFKSKEDIVRSFTEDHFGRLDALIAWGRDQPRTASMGHEILDRYITILLDGSEVFLFLERNQASLGTSGGGKQRFEQFRPKLNALVQIITGPGASSRSRIRAAAAIFAASASCMFVTHETLKPGTADEQDLDSYRLPDRDELRKIILELTDDLTRDVSGVLSRSRGTPEPPPWESRRVDAGNDGRAPSAPPGRVTTGAAPATPGRREQPRHSRCLPTSHAHVTWYPRRPLGTQDEYATTGYIRIYPPRILSRWVPSRHGVCQVWKPVEFRCRLW
jgi:AcrR family transcriptional regulator